MSYNPWLLLVFDSHINVEICSGIRACKYLFKYVLKVGSTGVIQCKLSLQGPDKNIIAFCEATRSGNGNAFGKSNFAGVCLGGNVVIPKGTEMRNIKRRQLQRDAVKRLESAGIPV